MEIQVLSEFMEAFELWISQTMLELQMELLFPLLALLPSSPSNPRNGYHSMVMQFLIVHHVCFLDMYTG